MTPENEVEETAPKRRRFSRTPAEAPAEEQTEAPAKKSRKPRSKAQDSAPKPRKAATVASLLRESERLSALAVKMRDKAKQQQAKELLGTAWTELTSAEKYLAELEKEQTKTAALVEKLQAKYTALEAKCAA